MINRAVSAAFETWQANASEGKDAEAAAEEGSDEDDQGQAGSIIWHMEAAAADMKHEAAGTAGVG